MGSKVWIDFATIKLKSKSRSELVCVYVHTHIYLLESYTLYTWGSMECKNYVEIWLNLNLNGFRLCSTQQNCTFGFVSKTKSRPTITPGAGWTIRKYSGPFPCIYHIIVVWLFLYVIIHELIHISNGESSI